MHPCRKCIKVLSRPKAFASFLLRSIKKVVQPILEIGLTVRRL